MNDYKECKDCVNKNTKVCNSCEQNTPTNFTEK